MLSTKIRQKKGFRKSNLTWAFNPNHVLNLNNLNLHVVLKT